MPARTNDCALVVTREVTVSVPSASASWTGTTLTESLLASRSAYRSDDRAMRSTPRYPVTTAARWSVTDVVTVPLTDAQALAVEAPKRRTRNDSAPAWALAATCEVVASRLTWSASMDAPSPMSIVEIPVTRRPFGLEWSLSLNQLASAPA